MAGTSFNENAVCVLPSASGIRGQAVNISFVDATQNGLTALAGGGQSGATAITTPAARFTTVATAGDSALLPVSFSGEQIIVKNAGANSMNVFPNAADNNGTGGIINALAANAAIAIPPGKTMTFTCFVAGTWDTMLTA